MSSGVAGVRSTGRALNAVHVGLSLAAVAAMALAMWASLIYAKDATNLAGDEMLAQRIFYIHMGCNIGAFAGFIVSVVGSIGYLVTRNLDWDRLAHAAVEVGTVIGLGTILTGIFWAKPTWNTWWTWDPRLTTSTITVLVYVAYLMLRNGIENRQARARFAAMYAVFAFLSVPLTYFSARLFRSIHPVVFGNGSEDAQGGFAVGSTMVTTLEITISAFVILFSALLILRWRQLRIEDELAELQDEASN